MGKGRPFLRALFLACVVLLPFLTTSSASDDPPEDPPPEQEGPDPHFLDSVWVGGSFGVGRYVDPTGLFEAHDPAAGDVYALSVDEYRGRVWVFAKGHLQIRDFSGALLKEILMPVPAQLTDGLVSPDESVRDGTLEDVLCTTDSLNINSLPYQALWPLANLATNYTDGTTWLSIGNQLYKYDVDGEWVETQTSPKLITGLAVDPKRSRWWVGSCGNVRLYDSTGAQLFQRGFTQLLSYVKDIHFDRGSDRLWIARRDYLISLGPDGEVLSTKRYGGAALANVEFVAGDGNNGVWLAAGGVLRHVNSNNTTDQSLSLFQGLIPLAGLSVTPHADAVALASNLRNQSAWLANRQTLLHITASGQVLKTLPLQNLVPSASTQAIGLPVPLLQPVIGVQDRIRPIAVYTDLIPPEVDIVCPDREFVGFDFRVLVGYRDIGLGVDLRTMRFELNGTPLDLDDCSRISGGLSCVDEPNIAALDLGEETDTEGGLPKSEVEPLKRGQYQCNVTSQPEGPAELTVRVSDYAGNRSEPASRSFVIDYSNPAIVIESPQPFAVLNTTEVTIRGHVSEPAELFQEDEPLTLDAENRFSYPVVLNQGDNYFSFYAYDPAGHEGYAGFSYFVDSIAPQAPDGGKIDIVSVDGLTWVLGRAGSVEAGILVTVRNLDTGAEESVFADENGAFGLQIVAEVGHRLLITTSDTAQNSSAIEKPVLEPLYVEIQSPQPGALVNLGHVLVMGTVVAKPGSGISVNGEPAVVRPIAGLRSEFYSYVPVDAATQEIVATVVDRSGGSNSYSVSIIPGNLSHYRVEADPFTHLELIRK